MLMNDLLTVTPLDLGNIGDAIKLMLDSSQLKLFKFLHDADSGKEVYDFKGTMHSEVSLASLLEHSKVGTIDGYEDIRTQLKVGYLFPTFLCHHIFISHYNISVL